MRAYYKLSKPGIVYGNALTALAAFVFASHGGVQIPLLIVTLLGLSLCIAASCVINNVLDRDIDAHMERTKDRATVTGVVPPHRAILFASILGISGVAILFFFTTLYALVATLFGVLVYLCLYTPLKRRTPHSTIVGAFAGAVPPVVGYTAVTNALDVTALLLFLILVCWQMAHFFAIAIFRRDEYAAANVPIMSVRVGIVRTKVLMSIYTLLFGASVLTLALIDDLGALFTLPLAALSVLWAFFAVAGFWTKENIRFARRMFLYSIIVLLTFSFLLAIS